MKTGSTVEFKYGPMAQEHGKIVKRTPKGDKPARFSVLVELSDGRVEWPMRAEELREVHCAR